MKILVCLKQVPDGNSRLAPAADGRWIEEDALTFVPNEFDLFALEAALKLKDADAGTEVVLVTIGPDRAKQALRTGLAMGADRAVHLQDAAFQGGDAWSNATALAAVAQAEGPFDLVFCGLQASDGNAGQTGPLVAEMLESPCATGVMSLVLASDAAHVERELDGDRREQVRLPFPAVVTFQTGAGDGPPRYANIKGIMAAKKKELKTPGPADLGIDAAAVGSSGRRLVLRTLAEPPRGQGAAMLSGSPQEIAAELVQLIRAKTGLL